MPLASQIIQFPLIKGLNTKVDSKQIAFGEMSLLENVVFKTVEKFQKRNGYSALSTNVLTSIYSYTFQKLASTISSGSWCGSYKDEQVIGDGFGLYSYSTNNSKWSYKGRCQIARCELTPIYQSSSISTITSGNALNTTEHADCAINSTSGLSLYAWEMYAAASITQPIYYGVRYALFDNTTGTQLFVGTLANTISRPRCIAIGSSLFLVYYDSGASALKAISITNTGASAATSLVTDIDTTTPNYDVIVNNSLIYIGYYSTVPSIKIKSFNSSLVNQATGTAADTAQYGLGIFADTSNNIWCAYNNALATAVFILNSTLNSTVLASTTVELNSASTYVRNVTGVYDGTKGVIFYDFQTTPNSYNDSGITTTATFTQPAVGSTVTVNTSGSVVAYIGQIIFLSGAGNPGGHYLLTDATATDITIKNLDFPLNGAVGSTVANTKSIFPTSGARIASYVRYNTITAAGSVGTAAYYAGTVALASKAFLYSGVAHVMVGRESATQPTNFITSLYDVNTSATNTTPAHFVGRVASNFAGGSPTKSILPAFTNYTGSKYKTATTVRILDIERTSGNNSFANFLNGVDSIDIDLAPTQISKAEVGQNLHIASGSLMMYDGTSVVEHGFHAFPEFPTVAEAGGTGRVAAGTYGYCAVYAWTDGQGQTHRSAPSQISTIVVSGGNDIVQVLVPSLGITQKSDINIEIYRTAAGGSVFYRIDSNLYGASSAGVSLFPLKNTVGVPTVIGMLDVYADSEIIGNQQLYTTGEIENIVSPSPRGLSAFKNRLLVNVSDNQTQEWYSKQVVPGSPVEFNDAFVQNTDQTSGDIVGAVQLDDKEIIFKGKNIYYVVGTGPAPSGANNDFTDPTLIATDVGLVDHASIVVMPLGVMFKSEKGVYLLDRSLTVQYIGAKVESYNAYSVVTAQLIANVNQVRFILSSGQAIVYDYFVGEWSVFTNHAAVDSLISGSTFYYLKSDGTLMKETDGVYSDNGSFISMKLRTGWIQLAGVQGFQRLWRIELLGSFISNHQLTVALGYDFSASTAQTVTLLPNSATNYFFGVQPARQKCSSIQITIQDVFTDTIGESYSLSNIAFEVGAKKGLNKLPAAQSYG